MTDRSDSQHAFKNIDVLCNLSSQLGNMTKVQRKIAEYILNHSEVVLNLSITQLADKIQVNPASVTRFCQRLGFAGYADFCYSIKRQTISPVLGDDDYYDFTGASSIELIHKSVAVFNHMISETMLLLDDKKLDYAATLLARARNVYIYAHGSGNSSALYAQALFMQSGVSCFAFYEPSQVLISASLAKEDDVIVVISFSGRSSNLIDAIRIANKRKAKVIAITGFSNSPIDQMANVGITYYARIKDDVRFMYLARICEVAIIGILQSSIISKNQNSLGEHLSTVKWAIYSMRQYNNSSIDNLFPPKHPDSE